MPLKLRSMPHNAHSFRIVTDKSIPEQWVIYISKTFSSFSPWLSLPLSLLLIFPSFCTFFKSSTWRQSRGEASSDLQQIYLEHFSSLSFLWPSEGSLCSPGTWASLPMTSGLDCHFTSKYVKLFGQLTSQERLEFYFWFVKLLVVQSSFDFGPQSPWVRMKISRRLDPFYLRKVLAHI